MKNLNVNYEVVNTPVIRIKNNWIDDENDEILYTGENAIFLMNIIKNKKDFVDIITKMLKENNYNKNDEESNSAEYIIENNFIDFLDEKFPNTTIPFSCVCEEEEQLKITIYDDYNGVELFSINLDDIEI